LKQRDQKRLSSTEKGLSKKGKNLEELALLEKATNGDNL